MYAISDDNCQLLRRTWLSQCALCLFLSVLSSQISDMSLSARTDYNKIKLHSLNSPHRGQGLSSSLMHLHA